MTGRARALTTVPSLAALSRRQARVVTRTQLTHLGVSSDHVARQVAAERWQLAAPDVVVLHNGPVVGRTLLWAATLAAGPTAALCSWTTLELVGLIGWARPGVHVVVPRGARPHRLDGVVVHESRRHSPDDVERLAGLPTHSAARAAVDAAAWNRSPRTAVGLLAAVVQQGLTTTDALHEALDRAGAVRHRRVMRLSLVDIAGGSDSLAEIDFVRLCRRAGLPEPARQSTRRDTRGRLRYLDVEWDLSDGRRLVVEVDGIGHMEVKRWYDDLMRTAELPLEDARVLVRIPATAARTEPDRVLAILRRHLT